MNVLALIAAKDFLEKGNAILRMHGCVLAEDFQSNIVELQKDIDELLYKKDAPEEEKAE